MKAFISIIGKDKVGIISTISSLLVKLNINIEDISQTVVKDNFTMVIRVDMSKSDTTFADTERRLNKLGAKLEVDITIIQKELLTNDID